MISKKLKRKKIVLRGEMEEQNHNPKRIDELKRIHHKNSHSLIRT